MANTPAPFSLEERLKKQKEEALQQAKSSSHSDAEVEWCWSDNNLNEKAQCGSTDIAKFSLGHQIKKKEGNDT